MKFSSLVTPVVVVAVVVVAAAVGVPAVLGDCTSSQRLATLAQINDAFNEPDLFTATQKIRAFPLQEDCPAIVYVSPFRLRCALRHDWASLTTAPSAINGLPGIEFGFDATSSKNFAIIARQVFNKVVTQYTDYGNGTSLFDAVIVRQEIALCTALVLGFART